MIQCYAMHRITNTNFLHFQQYWQRIYKSLISVREQTPDEQTDPIRRYIASALYYFKSLNEIKLLI